jgi:colicin import membrane protein
MSAALAYREPHFFVAGALALAVHLAFFVPLYFATRWQSHSSERYTVEMWNSLPTAEVVPKVEPAPALPPPVRVEPTAPAKVVAPVLPPVKAEIEIRDKKSKKTEVKPLPAKTDAKKEEAVAKARQEAEQRKLAEQREQRELAAYEASSERRRQAVQAQVRAEVNAATQTQIDRYQDMIRNKIRRKMRTVSDVPDSAEAIFKVTLLPDGTLMDDPVLVKSSGYPAYDDAAERAILSAEPLPVPTDVSLQKMFRELKLSIKP